MGEEITHLDERRWLQISPTTCNPNMITPPLLSRANSLFDTNNPHLIIPSSSRTSICHVYINGTGCNPTQDGRNTW